MNRLQELKNPIRIQDTIGWIHKLTTELKHRTVNLMEVCGTHTMSVYRHGIKQVIPSQVHLLAGPGCPVCVTPTNIVDAAILLAKIPQVILTTFGDMIKVPGKESTLAIEKANGLDIRIVYSPLDALRMAQENPKKEIVFIGVGFETTAPIIAATILKAEKENITNFSVLCSHKVMPPPMKALVESREIRIDGFICPGHVSTITGAKIYDFLARDYHIPCVVAGFEPLDILQTIAMLLKQILENRAEVEIQYDRCITWNGNEKAQLVMDMVFEFCDTEWRGLGNIPGSGLRLREKFQAFDALVKFNIPLPESFKIPGCICGDILRGIRDSLDCRLFNNVCTPEHPIGPCMVSSEGTCAAFYKYEKKINIRQFHAKKGRGNG